MSKYRRIEVNAFRRRVTIVSGEWPAIGGVAPPFTPEDAVSVSDADACEPVEPASAEGQQILVEAVLSLERRLSPEALETIRSGRIALVPCDSRRSGFQLWLQFLHRLICPRVLRLARKEK